MHTVCSLQKKPPSFLYTYNMQSPQDSFYLYVKELKKIGTR